MKTQAVCELGNGSHQMLNLLGSLSWTSQPPEVKYTLVVIKPPNLWYSVRAAQVNSALILVSWLSFMGALRSSFPFSCPFWCRWTDMCKLRVSLTWQEKSGVRHVSQSSNLLSLHAHVYLYVRPKIRAFIPRRKNRATQWTSPADATRKRDYCRLRKQVTLISWEAEHTEQQIGQAFMGKKTTLSAYYIRVTKWLVICLQSNPIGTNFAGYMFTKQFYWYNFAGFCSNLKQFYWYKRHGLLFKLKAILLVQTARAFV